jgi:hypothetical protein
MVRRFGSGRTGATRREVPAVAVSAQVGHARRVDRAEFMQLREAVTNNLPPASGAPLSDAAARLRRRLVASVMFAQVEVEVTDDPERLLVALVRYRPGTRPRQVSSFLEAVWVTELRLSALDAFNFLVEDGQVELEAVTGDQGAGYFVSLLLVALEGDAQDFDGEQTPVDDADGATPSPYPADASRARKRFWRKS